MKELTTELKAKFFAQYWGQRVRTWIDSQDDYLGVLGSTFMTNPYIKKTVLALKSLSSITDEEASELAMITFFANNTDDFNDCQGCWSGEGDIDNRGNHMLEIGMGYWEGVLTINDQSGIITLYNKDGEVRDINNTVFIVDYLRSKGYALPFMGISVEHMVEAGWIKLQEAKI